MPIQEARLGSWSLSAPAGMTISVAQTWTYAAGVPGHDEGDPIDLTDGVTVYVGGTDRDLDDFTGATAYTATISGADNNIATISIPVPAGSTHELLRAALNGVTKMVGKLRPVHRGGESDVTVDVRAGETAAVEVKALGTVITAAGPPGPPGPPGPSGYTHEQGAPAAVWDIVHNLGYSPAGIFVTDSGGTQHIGFQVEHLSPAHTRLTHRTAFGGTARLS